MSFDRLRTNGKWVVPFVLPLSNHKQNALVQHFPTRGRTDLPTTPIRGGTGKAYTGRNMG